MSFSIKQKEPETTSIDTSRVALPVDPESDEEGNENSGSLINIVKISLERFRIIKKLHNVESVMEEVISGVPAYNVTFVDRWC